MKLFILDVENLTGSFHSGGGLIVVAEGFDQAKTLIQKDEDIRPSQAEWDKAKIYELSGSPEPLFYIFPDAGCC